jgi:RsiW-degrading membrane proteinase PrsW (M82 family)
VDFIVIASLRQIEKDDGHSAQSVYTLVQSQSFTLGRDLDCEIPVDPLVHTAVSRRHAEIRPVTTSSGNLEASSLWWVCDLNSSNGTFVNGQRLVGCQVLQNGDRVVLGQHGPAFSFEQTEQAIVPPNPSNIPDAPPYLEISGQFSDQVPARVPAKFRSAADDVITSADIDRVTLTQLLPIFSTGLEIRRKAYILPAFVTIVAVVSLFFAIGDPDWFNGILATYLGLAAYYRVYQLCGKKKAWWILVLMGLVTIALVQSPVFVLFTTVFRQILPGQVSSKASVSFLNMFFGAGLMEELLKAVPLFVLAFIGLGRSDRWRDRYGIREPLDGILLGTASAMGFTLLETVGQYVPGIVQSASTLGSDASQAQGLQILIARLLGSVAGHMAYSGYFGYAIGLAVLKPRGAALTILVGWLTAAVLHTMWNSVGGLPLVGPFALAIIGLLSYALLGAAILKARSLSPSREKNFATRLG